MTSPHILYNYPGMLTTSAEMTAQASALDLMGGNVQSEQAALGAAWQGPTGMTVGQWISQWNTALQETTSGLRGMANAHDDNTMQMMGRDAAEGAKWGG